MRALVRHSSDTKRSLTAERHATATRSPFQYAANDCALTSVGDDEHLVVFVAPRSIPDLAYDVHEDEPHTFVAQLFNTLIQMPLDCGCRGLIRADVNANVHLSFVALRAVAY
jgi:hypothetical protein